MTQGLAGAVDLQLKPTGLPKGYDQLVGSSVEIPLPGLVIRLAKLDDIAFAVAISDHSAVRRFDQAALTGLANVRATTCARLLT